MPSPVGLAEARRDRARPSAAAACTSACQSRQHAAAGLAHSSVVCWAPSHQDERAAPARARARHIQPPAGAPRAPGPSTPTRCNASPSRKRRRPSCSARCTHSAPESHLTCRWLHAFSPEFLRKRSEAPQPPKSLVRNRISGPDISPSDARTLSGHFFTCPIRCQSTSECLVDVPVECPQMKDWSRCLIRWPDDAQDDVGSRAAAGAVCPAGLPWQPQHLHHQAGDNAAFGWVHHFFCTLVTIYGHCHLFGRILKNANQLRGEEFSVVLCRSRRNFHLFVSCCPCCRRRAFIAQ